MLKNKLIIFLVTTLCHLNPVAADEPGEEEAFNAMYTGFINSVDLQKRYVVIDDRVYYLSLGLQVVGKNGVETDFALDEGAKVRFELNAQPGGPEKQIIKLWLVP